MIGRALMTLSALVLLALGVLHLIYTFSGSKLMPRDAALQARMNEVNLVITRQTTVWRAWIGFNASHSMGAILFGLVYGFLANAYPELLFGSPFLLVVGFAMLGGFAVLAKLYWFRIPFTGVVLSLICYVLGIVAWHGGWIAGAAAQGAGPEIHTEDVDLFYKLYDATDGHPTAEQLQRNYLDAGSEGLHQLARLRNVTGARIADALAKRPELYVDAKRCMDVLPRVRPRVEAALRELVRLYPQARTPPITVAVSRGKPVGVGSPVTGLQIGLEALCGAQWMNPDVEDRFVHVIAHEYAHVQQVAALVDDPHPTVLVRALTEGAAELVAELTSGKPGFTHFAALTKGREKEIETAFVADVDQTDLSRWVDNSTMEQGNDLGYWVGYRIAKAYYQRAADKQQAVRDILDMSDPKAFLAKSGWRPGMEL